MFRSRVLPGLLIGAVVSAAVGCGGDSNKGSEPKVKGEVPNLQPQTPGGPPGGGGKGAGQSAPKPE